jgi:salicylate hydroxylase
VAGGGIGGLTAVLALARHGFDVEVFKGADVLREVGAGVRISTNTFRALFKLGRGERLAPANGCFATRWTLFR